MKITLHKGKHVTIEGNGIYIVRARANGTWCDITQEPQSEAHVTITHWVIHAVRPDVSRLTRFFKLIPVIWRFTK